MTRFRTLRGFLRTLVGLPDRSGGFWGIDRCVMNDIERARWRRSMRESGRASMEWLRRWFGDPAFCAVEAQRALEPPPVRVDLYSPEAYRALVARAGGSLRPEAERRRASRPRDLQMHLYGYALEERAFAAGDLEIDENGDLVPAGLS